jgi:hypothetical protein
VQPIALIQHAIQQPGRLQTIANDNRKPASYGRNLLQLMSSIPVKALYIAQNLDNQQKLALARKQIETAPRTLAIRNMEPRVPQ